MPRIRTLKPDHRLHRKVGPLSHLQYRLWVGMILEADDEGRLVADPDQLRAQVFGFHGTVKRGLIEDSLRALANVGLLKLYSVEGVQYAWFQSWHDHQRINRPTPSRLPAYDNSLRAHGGLTPEGKGMEGKGMEEEAATPPALEGSGFRIAPSILEALEDCPHFRQVGQLRQPAFWQAQIVAYEHVQFDQELRRAQAWISANSSKAPRRDVPRFLHNWFRRSEETVR